MDKLLASVFDIELTEDEEGRRRLALLNEKNYILTLDFALKVVVYCIFYDNPDDNLVWTCE